jgi:hypothetical protein
MSRSVAAGKPIVSSDFLVVTGLQSFGINLPEARESDAISKLSYRFIGPSLVDVFFHRWTAQSTCSSWPCCSASMSW